MRASFLFSSSRVLAALGTGALLVLIIVFLTGGFVIDAGPLYFSARGATGPLVLSVLAWGAAARGGRASLAATAMSVTAFVSRWSTALAVIFAASTAAIGVSYGTYAASSADAAGYISQATLLANGALVREEPLAREVGWGQAEWTFSPLGYKPGPHTGEIVPTYPPGLPLTMAPVASNDLAPFLVTPLLGAIAVLCSYVLGIRFHSRTAGLVACALMATSPIVLFQIVQPMSDVPVTAWWALALVFAITPLRVTAFAAGAASGLAILTRPNLLPLAGVVAAAATQFHPIRRWRQLLVFSVALLPAIGAQALINARLYGNPLASGYGGASDLFSAATLLPNLRAYTARILEGEMPALLLVVFASAICLLTARHVRDTRSHTTSWSAPSGTDEPERVERGGLWLAFLFCGITLASYLAYAEFAEWSYLRFLLPAFPIAFVVAGSVVAASLRRCPVPLRGVLLLAALAVVCSVNVTTAAREQAFNLWRYEARYRTAGQYLASTLPSNAAIITVQESASVRHYTGLPIVRWDLLPVDLDVAVERLRALGRYPVVLIEEPETGQFQARFPMARAARLDWTPTLDVGEETRVRLFDPAQRTAITDRLR